MRLVIWVTISQLFPSYTDIQIIHLIYPYTAHRDVQRFEFCGGLPDDMHVDVG